MADTHQRLRAVWDMSVAEVREYCGRHEYDGVIQDLSPDGVRAGLRRLGNGDSLTDGHDEAHLAVFERAARVGYGELELHRSNPYLHIANLDLACYDREYAPEGERQRARAAHLAAWPDAVDGAIRSLDAVTAPVGEALADAARGPPAGGTPHADEGATPAAGAAPAPPGRHPEKGAAGG